MRITRILRARRIAGIPQHAIARPLKRTEMWLSLAERGLIPLAPEMETRILILIRRLAKLNETVALKKQELVEGLDLGTRAKRKTPQSRRDVAVAP